MRTAMLCLFTWMLPVLVHAGGISVIGGGDELALQFQKAYSEGVAEIKLNLPDLYEQLVRAGIEKLPENIKIVVVNTELPVQVNGERQYSVAVNDPSQNLILLNRVRWITIPDVRVQRGIAVHEIGSLHGLESTGYYPISGKYISHFGLNPSDMESVATNCTAPTSTMSACSEHVKDIDHFVEKTTQVTGYKSDKKEKNGTVDSHERDGKYAEFNDENKFYDIVFNRLVAGGGGEIAAMRSLKTQVTSDPKQKLRDAVIKLYKIKNGKITTEFIQTTQLGTDIGQGRTLVRGYPDVDNTNLYAADSIQHRVKNPDGSGTMSQVFMDLNIKLDDSSWVKTLQFISAIKPSDAAEFKDGLGSKLLASIDLFSVNHLAALRVKAELNRCLQAGKPGECTGLRQEYEAMDKDRDQLFFTMVEAADMKVKWPSKPTKARKKSNRDIPRQSPPQPRPPSPSPPSCKMPGQMCLPTDSCCSGGSCDAMTLSCR